MRSALFPHAESDYTSSMRVWAIFFAAWCLQGPAVFPATEQSPHELYDAIKALRIDPTNVYRITPGNHIQLRRGEGVLSAFPSSIRNSSTDISVSRTKPPPNLFANSAPPILWPRQIPPSARNGILQ